MYQNIFTTGSFIRKNGATLLGNTPTRFVWGQWVRRHSDYLVLLLPPPHSNKSCVRSFFKYGQLIIRQPKTFLALLASNYSITTDPEKMLSELKKVYPSYDWRNELTHLALFDIKDSFELKRKIGLTSSKTRWDDPLGPSTICAAR